VRYDQRGSGLSDRNRTDFTLEAELKDLETVIEHLKLKRLALLGISLGGPIAAAYTARHPRCVSRLILYGTFARGEAINTEEVKASLISLVRAHWGIGSKALADLFLPGTDAAGSELFAKYQRACATPEMAAQLLGVAFRADVAHLLPSLRVPTLVLHRQQEQVVPFQLGRELAALIPNARFVPLEGRHHLSWYGDADSVLRAIAEFLGDPVTGGRVVESRQPVEPDLTVAMDDPVAREARSFIVALDWGGPIAISCCR
jgi:pimeloyl-ACP methyl ester carboxylesterase